jgi:hypothetical protein
MTYYVKVGKKYESVGFSGPTLFNGIWFIKSDQRGRSSNNIATALAQLPDDPEKLNVFCNLVSLENTILKVMNKCWPPSGKGCSLAECARRISTALAMKEIKILQKKRYKPTKNLKIRGELG